MKEYDEKDKGNKIKRKNSKELQIIKLDLNSININN